MMHLPTTVTALFFERKTVTAPSEFRQ